MLSQLLRASPHLDGVLLEAVTVLGVPSPPWRVLANGAIVSDFCYRSDTQVSPQCHPGEGWWPGRGTECSSGARDGTGQAMGALPRGSVGPGLCQAVALQGAGPPWALSWLVLTLLLPSGAESPCVTAHVGAVCDLLVLSHRRSQGEDTLLPWNLRPNPSPPLYLELPLPTPGPCFPSGC